MRGGVCCALAGATLACVLMAGRPPAKAGSRAANAGRSRRPAQQGRVPPGARHPRARAHDAVRAQPRPRARSRPGPAGTGWAPPAGCAACCAALCCCCGRACAAARSVPHVPRGELSGGTIRSARVRSPRAGRSMGAWVVGTVPGWMARAGRPRAAARTHPGSASFGRSVLVTRSKSHMSVGRSALSPSPTRHLCADATSIPPRAALIAAPCARRWSSADSGSSSIDVLEVNYQGSKCDLKKKKDDMKSVARPGQSIPCRKPTKKKGSGRRAPRERAGADREARNWRCAAHFPAAILPCKIHFDIMNVRY